MSFRRARVLSISLLLVPVLVIFGTGVLWLPRLPPTIPVQWSSEGVTNSAPAVLLALSIGIMTLIVTALGAASVVSATSLQQLSEARVAAAVSGGVSGALTAVWVTVAALSLDTRPDQSASVGGWPLVALALGIAWALAPAVVLPRAPLTADAQ
jgi:hypothetical protein